MPSQAGAFHAAIAPPCVLNDGPVEVGDERIHELFQAAARRTPDALAVVTDTGESVAYGELDRRSDLLAACLHEEGIGPEDRVGIAMTHGIDLLTGVLGVLKAGAAFVPMDPDQPRERAAAIIEDAGIALVVTQERLVSRAPLDRIIKIEEVSKRRLVPLVAHRGSPDNLAYVLFTSGSTGRPKGVLTSHRTLVSAYRAWDLLYDLRNEIRCIGQTAAFSFAVFQADWIRSLCSGGKLVLCSPATVLAPDCLLDAFDRHGVQFTEMVPGAFRLLVRRCQETGRKPASLRMVSIGSDRWYMREHRHARQVLAPATKVIHTFGLTETTIDTAYYLDCDENVTDTALTPIGRPWLNVRMYILDSGLRPAPAGEVGELFVGGDLVTRGYARRPGLTAERFLPDPWSRRPGGRMYKTGDLACLNINGDVEFLGRLDHQVKVRGFRVEPGEVEASIELVPGVAQCVAVARSDESGESRLVAYVLPSGNGQLTPASLQAEAAARLPGYMVPTAYVIVHAFPLTSSGKIDRTSLPAPRPEDVPRVAVSRAPAGPDEEFLARVWEELLGVERVGAEEDFFRMGGHSLLAVRMLARVNNPLEADLRLADVFEHPTIAGLARLARERHSTGESGGAALSSAGSTPRFLPLSKEQARFWLEALARPNGSDYCISTVIPVPDGTTPETLIAAINAMIARHEALRTVFRVEDGAPMQVVKPHTPISIRVVQNDPARVLGDLSREPFDLGEGPLVRAVVLQHGGRMSAAVAVHHIACDGLSLGVMARELTALCIAGADDPGAALAPARPYSEYVLWQQGRDPGEALADLRYWVGALCDAPTTPSLPTDFARREDRAIRGASVGVRLPDDLAAALRDFCSRRAVTPFVVFAAAVGLLMEGIGAASPALVAYPVTTRARPEDHDVVGLFVDTQVLPIRATGRGFDDLVGAVHESLVGGLRHSRASFDEVVSGVRRACEGATPHIAVMLTVEEASAHADSAPPSWQSGLGTAKFDWTITVRPGRETLNLVWEYDASLFAATTIKLHADRLVHLLDTAMRDSSREVSLGAFMPPAERRLWDQLAGLDAVEQPAEQEARAWESVIDRIGAIAAAAPAATAIWTHQGALTYQEVWARSSRVAAALQQSGAGREDVVGIRMSRDADLVAAILGVMRAGCGYLPIDIEYPASRVRDMLADSGAKAVLTSDCLEPENLPPRTVQLAIADAMACAGVPAASPSSPRHLAYVMYTSGSTGRPKGVMIEHRSVAAIARWMRETYSPSVLDGVLAVTSVCFDLSIFEILGTLAAGGRIVMTDGPLAVADLPRNASPRLLNTVPSAAAELANAGSLPRSVSLMNVAGEALNAATAQRLLAQTPEVVNLYGPTETCVYSTAARVRGDDASPSIGRPLPMEYAYVLDERLRPAPVGSEGELYIGGIGVGRGYLGRPGLTADRFMPDPFRRVPGARMYRTGDHVRWRPDGQLAFHGRVDGQVKVRGFRVELGEIEAALADCPGVREACAAVHARSGAGARLVAFVVGEQGDAFKPGNLREYLRQRLPGHMIPASIQAMRELPRTRNGKIDRAALVDLVVPDDAVPGSAPGSPTEAWLVGLWREMLDIEQLGVDDDLTRAGATSLLIVRALARIQSHFGVRLSWRQVLQSRTIRELSALIQSHDPADAQRPGQEMARVDRTRTLPLSFAQEGVWLASSRAAGNNFSIGFVIPIDRGLTIGAVRTALGMVIARHEALRTTFRSGDGVPFQVIGPAAIPEVPILRIGAGVNAVESVKAGLMRLESAPFDFEGGPLARFAELWSPSGERLLLACVHHLVFDGASIPVFTRDFRLACAAACRGGEPSWPALELQPADVAAHERRTLVGEVLDDRLAYWRSKLAKTAPPPALPGGYRAPGPTGNGATQTFWLGRELRDATLACAQACGTTNFSVLLAATATALSRVCGQEHIRVACAVANRHSLPLESIVGLLVDLVVLGIDIPGNRPFEQIAGDLQRSLADAVEHALPLELLMRELRPLRKNGRSEWFQIVATMLTSETDDSTPSIDMPGVEGPFAVAAHHDLAFSFHDNGVNLGVVVDYDLGCCTPEVVVQIVEVFRRTLAAAVVTPRAPVARLPLCDRDERERVRRVRGPAGAAPDQCALSAIWRHAARDGTADAVCSDEETVAYGALCARADRLAARIVSVMRTGQAGRRVAVRVERSVDSVVAFLGVLRAGAVYVPIPISYPAERAAAILADARPDVVIGPRNEAIAGACAAIWISDLSDADSSQVAGHLPPAATAEPEHPAYIIYTSGSTGVPKGVIIPHRGLNACVAAMRAMLNPTRPRVLQFSSLGFDASIFEHFLALAFGGTLCIPGSGERMPGAGLEDFISRAGITDIIVPASVMSALGDLSNTRVRRIILGGERVPQALADALADRFDLINAYGPTEASVWCTATRLHKNGTVHIGRSIAHATVHVLDDLLRPVPAGVIGEICVGGWGVADGYSNRPGLTAASFVPDPLSDRPGARLYRTGDLGRLRPDGTIEFAGRRDQQVKINGVRIELGEIEAVLARVPGVAACTVLARTSATGVPGLVGYVVPGDGVTIDTAGALEVLRRHLPSSMVPNALHMLNALPVTANGKLDAARLPEISIPSESGAHQRPEGPYEELAAAAWSSVIGETLVGRRSDFFALGGSSLSAARVAARLSEAIGRQVPVDLVMRVPVLCEFAAALTSLSQGASADEEIPVRDSARFPLTSAQRALWIARHRAAGANTVFFAIPTPPNWPEEVVRRAVAAIHERHEPLRTWFGEERGRAFQEVAAGTAAPFETAVLPADAESAKAELARIAETLASISIDAGKPPAYRAIFAFSPGKGGHLLVAMHHLIADGWSVAIYSSEVHAICGAFVEGRPNPLAPLRTRYGDYALWEQRPGAITTSCLAHWDGLLLGCEPEFPLPRVQCSEQPSRVVAASRAAPGSLTIELGEHETRGLIGRARAEGATLFMAMAAALGMVLSRTCGTRDIVLCTDASVRTRRALEPLIGLLLNQLIIRFTLPERSSPADAIRAARAACLASYRGQHVPLELIIARQSERRKRSMARCARVKLNLQPFDDPSAGGGAFPMGTTAADMPLTFFMSQSAAGLRGSLVFDRSLIDLAAAASIVSEFQSVLCAISEGAPCATEHPSRQESNP